MKREFTMRQRFPENREFPVAVLKTGSAETRMNTGLPGFPGFPGNKNKGGSARGRARWGIFPRRKKKIRCSSGAVRVLL